MNKSNLLEIANSIDDLRHRSGCDEVHLFLMRNFLTIQFLWFDPSPGIGHRKSFSLDVLEDYKDSLEQLTQSMIDEVTHEYRQLSGNYRAATHVKR